MFETKWYKKKLSRRHTLYKINAWEMHPFLVSTTAVELSIKLYWDDRTTGWTTLGDPNSQQEFDSYLKFLYGIGYREISAAEAVAMLL